MVRLSCKQFKMQNVPGFQAKPWLEERYEIYVASVTRKRRCRTTTTPAGPWPAMESTYKTRGAIRVADVNNCAFFL